MERDNPILIALKAAQSAFKAGDHRKALEACLEVLDHVPNHPMAHLLAGLLQQEAENYAEAVRHLRFAVAHDPKDASSRDALGVCLLSLGRHEEALPHLRQVLKLQPENASTRYNLGRCLLDLRRYDDAAAVYEEHVANHPGDAEAFNHLGLARLAKGNAEAAEQCFQTAINLNPHDPLFHANHAQALAHRGQGVQAHQAYSKAIEIDPASASLRSQHGWFLIWFGDITRAEDRFREALQRDPEHERANAGLAATLERRREIDVGLQVLRPFISSVSPEPKVALSFAKLSQRSGTPESALPVIRRAMRPGVPRLQEASLRFAEGEILDAMGQVDEAFDAFKRANTAQGEGFNAAAHEAFVDSIIEVFSPDFFASVTAPKLDTRGSIIVCGMPRSGTSLVEQILATHPEIFGGGELMDLPTMAVGLQAFLDSPHRYPAVMSHVDATTIEHMAQARMESLRAISDRSLVVDKLPQNFLHLGLVAVATPGAKIIHCVRDPVDTCLSCYFQHFNGPGYAFTNSLEALSSYYHQYHRLMAHWAEVLPLKIHTVQYEEMVANTEEVSRAALDFVGVEWDERVLSFHENERLCATASYAQVQQPVYSSSVGRAERYRHHLEGLRSVAMLHQ